MNSLKDVIGFGIFAMIVIFIFVLLLKFWVWTLGIGLVVWTCFKLRA